VFRYCDSIIGEAVEKLRRKAKTAITYSMAQELKANTYNTYTTEYEPASALY